MSGWTPNPEPDAGRTRRDTRDLPPHHDPLKDRWRDVFWISMSTAIVVHFAVFLLMPAFQANPLEQRSFEAMALEIPPEVDIPPPPDAVPRPATPTIASAAIAEDITIAPTTFDANPVDYLPPPPPASTVSPERVPSKFTPYSVAPVLLNRAQVEALLQKEYPPLLKEAEVDGVVLIWLRIDTDGVPVDTEIKEPSGYVQFDAAAQRVAHAMRFQPAYNRDKAVEVWVSLPIVFSVNR